MPVYPADPEFPTSRYPQLPIILADSGILADRQASPSRFELYQQQVVDNLALFAHDPDALPHFLYAKEGSSQVVDTGGTTFGIDWGRSGVNKTSLGLSGMRQLNETWTLEPINDPRKLALMRCAYQTALANCGMGQVSQSCPDCQKRFDDFYTSPPPRPMR